MGKKVTDYAQVIKLLTDLKKEYPNYRIGQHISIALADYKDVWGITDKEVLFALEKYKTELEFNVVSDQEVDKIVKDAQDLTKLFQDEEGEDDYQ
jgi:hypothetical protein